MPDVTSWLGGGAAIDPAPRAIAAWTRIQHKPSAIQLKRHGVSGLMAAQTVRIEYSDTRGGSEVTGAGGKSSQQYLIIFGIRDHPTLPDTDIKRGDQLTIEGLQLRIIETVLTLGEIQAKAETLS